MEEGNAGSGDREIRQRRGRMEEEEEEEGGGWLMRGADHLCDAGKLNFCLLM